MGYHVIDPAAIEPTADRPCIQRTVGDAADLDRLAANVYEAAPGEQLPLAYHYHDEQEELFYVLDGELAVETPDGTQHVSEDTCFVAQPASPHRAYNPADSEGRVRVLAVGAPNTDDVHAYNP